MNTCTHCGQVINEVITIKGKPYGTTCGARLLGFIDFPTWFRGGDWDKAKIDHEAQQARLHADYAARLESIRQNWDFIKRFSIVYRHARLNENEFESKFLSDMACRYGIQFSKESAYQYDSFEDYAKAEQSWDKFEKPVISEKQSALLRKIIGAVA